MAGASGSLMHLGIGPIVTGSIIMQLFTGAKIISLDLTKAEDKAVYQGTQKVVVIAMIIIEAVPQVFGYLTPGTAFVNSLGGAEAGIGWAVKFRKADYIGKEALLEQKAKGIPRRLIGLEVTGQTIARQSARVLSQDQVVGFVTSGNYSPTLKRSLALALVTSGASDGELQVEVRGKVYPCHAVPIPFLSARVKGDPRAERTLPA